MKRGIAWLLTLGYLAFMTAAGTYHMQALQHSDLAPGEVATIAFGLLVGILTLSAGGTMLIWMWALWHVQARKGE